MESEIVRVVSEITRLKSYLQGPAVISTTSDHDTQFVHYFDTLMPLLDVNFLPKIKHPKPSAPSPYGAIIVELKHCRQNGTSVYMLA